MDNEIARVMEYDKDDYVEEEDCDDGNDVDGDDIYYGDKR